MMHVDLVKESRVLHYLVVRHGGSLCRFDSVLLVDLGLFQQFFVFASPVLEPDLDLCLRYKRVKD